MSSIQSPKGFSPTEQSQKNTRFKTFLFFEIGLLEIGFVLLFLVLTFGLLNYFNILRLSSVFPILSFLPTTKKEVTARSTDTHSTSQSDIEKVLTAFAKDTLKKDFLPNKTKSNKDADYYSMTWDARQYAAQLLYSLHPESSTILLTLTQYKKQSITLNSEIAMNVLKEVLNTDIHLPQLMCVTRNNTINCAVFTNTIEGKEGFGVTTKTASGSAITLMTCRIPKSSRVYQNITSCLSL